MKAIVKQEEPLAVIVPKPTRSEVIEAMTRLRVLQLEKERRERAERIKALKAEADELLLAYVRKEIGKLAASFHMGRRKEKQNASGRWEKIDEIEGASATIPLKFLPRRIEKLLVEINTLDRAIIIDEAQIRRDIRQGLSGYGKSEERISALLDTPVSRAALEAALEKLAA